MIYLKIAVVDELFVLSSGIEVSSWYVDILIDFRLEISMSYLIMVIFFH